MKRRDFIKNVLLSVCGVALLSNPSEAGIFKPSQNKLNKLLQKHSLVVYKHLRVSCFDGRGIKPIIEYLENGNFSGALVADKRVGKASALLLAYGKVKEVYTPVISKPAIEVFKKYKIKYFAIKIADNIMNQSYTDLCPMEKKVQNIDDPKQAYELFKDLISQSEKQ